jgi:VanZ family protein
MMPPLRNIVARFVLSGLLVLVLVSVLLPSTTLGWMRHRWVWFTYPLDFIESVGSAVNLVHAILFLLLGMAIRLALPLWRAWRVAAALVLLGVATELMQVLVPGRHARVSDVVVDVVAGLVGWAAMCELVRKREP